MWFGLAEDDEFLTAFGGQHEMDAGVLHAVQMHRLEPSAGRQGTLRRDLLSQVGQEDRPGGRRRARAGQPRSREIRSAQPGGGSAMPTTLSRLRTPRINVT